MKTTEMLLTSRLLCRGSSLLSSLLCAVLLCCSVPAFSAGKVVPPDFQVEQSRFDNGLHPVAGKTEKRSIFRKLCFWKKKNRKQARPNYYRTPARQTTRYDYLWEYILVLFVGLILEALAFNWILYTAITKSVKTAIYVFLGSQLIIAILLILFWIILTHNAPPPKIF